MVRRKVFPYRFFHPRAYAISPLYHPQKSALVHSMLMTRLCSSLSASLFFGASQHAYGERAKALGWQPRPVVLEDWADDGITSALAKLQ